MIITQQIGKAMSQAASRHNQNREQRLKPFLKAIETLSEKRQWSNGETVTLFNGSVQGQKAELYIKNESGFLNLYLFREGKTLMDRFYSQPFKIGYFSPRTGKWAISNNATDSAYLQWNLDTRKHL